MEDYEEMLSEYRQLIKDLFSDTLRELIRLKEDNTKYANRIMELNEALNLRKLEDVIK